MKTITNMVEKISPRNGEEIVHIDNGIEIIFLNHMDKASVEDFNKITLISTKDNRRIKTISHYSGIERKLNILVVHPPLASYETYRLQIKSGKQGPRTVLGEYLLNDYNIYFTTIVQDSVDEGFTEDFKDEDYEEKEEFPPAGPSIPDKDSTEEDEVEDEEVPTEQENDVDILSDPLNDMEINRLRLIESFPSSGDLVELNSPMVLIFNKTVDKKDLEENVFVKKSSVNSLLEKLNKEKLIKGTIESDEANSKEFVFTPSQTLEAGTEYQLVIKKELSKDLNNDIRIKFQTLFERMFADVDTVRLVLGAFADKLTDLELAKLINQQSNSIFQLASMMDSFNESDWGEDNGVIITFPYAASQYVVYSTAYYAILGQSLEGSSGISESIRLADLSVSGSSKSSDNLKDLLDLLKAEYDRWWNVLQGEAEEIEAGVPNPNYNMTTTIRSGGTPYPDFQTRVPFRDLGGV